MNPYDPESTTSADHDESRTAERFYRGPSARELAEAGFDPADVPEWTEPDPLLLAMVRERQARIVGAA